MSNIKEFLAVTTVENKIDDLDTKLSNKLDTTSTELKDSMTALDTSVGTKLDAQQVSMDASFADQKTAIDGISKTVVIGTPLDLAHKVPITSSQNWTSPITGTIYLTGVGGGGGGAGGYVLKHAASSTRVKYHAGGKGGSGASTYFRIPMAVHKGDVIEITVGTGGAGGAGNIGNTSSTFTKPGGNGTATTIRNSTAIAESRMGGLTEPYYTIVIEGGVGGSASVSVGNPRHLQPPTTAIAVTPSDFISDLQKIGQLIKGGNGGIPYTMYSGALLVPTAGKGSTPTPYSSIPSNNPNGEGGGGGSSALALDGFGNGGQGGTSNYRNQTVTSGKAGTLGYAEIGYN